MIRDSEAAVVKPGEMLYVPALRVFEAKVIRILAEPVEFLDGK